MTVRRAELSDKDAVLALLDEFRCDCIEQITGKAGESHTAREGGSSVYQAQKVNLESDNDLQRAHSFYKKYGFEMKAQRFIKKISN